MKLYHWWSHPSIRGWIVTGIGIIILSILAVVSMITPKLFGKEK